ncbi:MAG: DUF362 domain-containing protein [Firmicutes bacterium]|nr:DUF362 domain-containing protein [Bacillota bacterium]
MSKVVLIRCESYRYPEVRAAVEKGVALLNGPSFFAKPGEKILLKPNWVMAVPPEKCATTHPMVFKAVAEIFQKTGAHLSYGDSPGFHSPETAAQKTGCAAVALELEIPLADFLKGREIIYPDALQNRKFIIANGALDSDGIISLPKLKTHGFLKLTGAVKNQMGCIPGLLKGEFHAKLPDPKNFAKMLVDLTSFLKPRLYIMDGIMAMEGNGPMGGDPRPMNLLLFSTDPVALDATVCRVIQAPPELSYTITFGREAGLGTYLESEIELLGDPLPSFSNPHFSVNREPIISFHKRGGLFGMIQLIMPKPVITKKQCVKCGICVKMCPVSPKALDWREENPKPKTHLPPSYRYERCIRCYCCQEVCPEGAIKIREPFLRRIVMKKTR